MHPLRQLASEISHALEDKANIGIRLGNQRRDLEARQLAMVPAEGWPGKNADDRKINERRAYAEDAVCQAIQEQIARLEEALALVEVALETATNQRRAEEWKIRAHLVEAITGNVVTTQNGHGNIEDTGFDDFADDTADARLAAKFGENGHFEPDLSFLPPLPESSGIAAEEDIPF